MIKSRRGILCAAAALPAMTIAGCAVHETRKERAHFVLVHGAWHGAWCWNKVIPLLREHGHQVTAVDLPGRWSAPSAMSTIKPEDYAHVVEQVVRNSDRPVVLVGHSLGGATVSMAAELCANHIRRTVYLCAFMVPNGESVASILSKDQGTLIPRAVVRDAATNTSTVNPAFAREVFYEDCSDEDVRIALQLLSPEPGVMNRHQLKLSSKAYGKVDRAYIECTLDRAISIQAQRAMQAASPCSRVITLQASHSPFFSKPVEVTNALLELA